MSPSDDKFRSSICVHSRAVGLLRMLQNKVLLNFSVKFTQIQSLYVVPYVCLNGQVNGSAVNGQTGKKRQPIS